MSFDFVVFIQYKIRNDFYSFLFPKKYCYMSPITTLRTTTNTPTLLFLYNILCQWQLSFIHSLAHSLTSPTSPSCIFHMPLNWWNGGAAGGEQNVSLMACLCQGKKKEFHGALLLFCQRNLKRKCPTYGGNQPTSQRVSQQQSTFNKFDSFTFSLSAAT